MLKYASAQIMTAVMAPKDAGRRELRRFAHKHHFDYEVRPGYLYVRSRAISSRCNDNFDEFPAEELAKSWRTFIGKPVFVNHVNHDHNRARGVIIDAALHKDSNRDGSRDWWIEVLQEVDGVRFPRLAKEILDGNIARTSMGCDVAFSVCSACGNRATTPAEYCQHIPTSKGMMLYRRTASGQKVGEIIRETCYGLKFFENSLLVEPPADPTAYFLGVDTRGLDKAASAKADPLMYWRQDPDALQWKAQNPDWTQKTAQAAEEYPHDGFRHEAMRKGAPFADYKDFEDCTEKNSDKGDPDAYCGEIKHKTEDSTKESSRLAQLFEAINQEGGELPAFPWDKAPKINLPMTQKGWDDPRRQELSQAIDNRDMTAETDPKPSPYQGLIDKLPNYADQEMSNPYGMGTVQEGHTYTDKSKYPGDKKEQWARDRWEQANWPQNGEPRSAEGLARSRKNIRDRWRRWKKPLACDHNSCPPWAHGGDAHTLSTEQQDLADRHQRAWEIFNGGGEEGSSKESSKLAYGEQKAPEDVDTLREDACPVCGDRDTYDGATCQVCGYVAPPKIFQDPDLEKARQMDLRKDIAEFQDPANPNQVGPDGQPIGDDPMDPSALDENGNPINPDAADQGQQPGTLPGEVQAEVQPAGDPMDPNALGEEGQIPEEVGAPVDPSMLGPDGQPLPQAGQQMVAPDGTPIGPQVLPNDAVDHMGQPFYPGPNMPEGPGEPEGPEGPANPEDLDQDGQQPNPDAGGGFPGTPGDGVPDLMCPACGFATDASSPVSVNMDAQVMQSDGMGDGTQAGDVCPNCGSAQLTSPAQAQGETSLPVPGQVAPQKV